MFEKNQVGKPSVDKPWLKYYTKEQKNTPIPKMSVYDYLLECNKQYKGRIALNYFNRKITYEELFNNIDKVAVALIQKGVKKGDIITVSLPNIPEAVYLFYATSKLGAIANMIDPRTSSEGIKNYTKEVKSNLIFIVDSYYSKVKDFVDEGVVDEIISVSPAVSLPLSLNFAYKAKEFIEGLRDKEKKIVFNNNTINWSTFINSANLKEEIVSNYEVNSPLAIVHTGGTTGVPKGVVLSNENINAVALQSVLTGIDMKREHNWLDIMPPFIAYGLGMGLHLPLTIGMETILIPQFDPKKFDELLLKYHPIHMVGVPSHWGHIINSKKLANQDLSYMIAPTVGGDAMDKKLEVEANEFLRKHGCTSEIVKGYGLTEVCGGVAGTVPENNQIGSVGIPFVHTIISIFDPETGEELTYNEHGEICVTGPNTMLKYYNNDEATKEMLRVHDDGRIWVHTGDLGYMDEMGSLFIIDRIKRMIVRHDGFKIFPSLVEDVILLHPAVESVKVVGIADKEHRQGRLPKAHIVLKEQYKYNTQEIYEEIKKLCEEKLPEYSQPVAYKFRDALLFTGLGKVDYLQLEAEDLQEKPMERKLIKE